jgi:prolyl-tRNA editing enzyme YbaK/EbsC (Cys-tRNA(Pro) deacylase)
VNLARPEYVLEKTGYEIGGVPPFPHREEVNVIPDISLTRFSYVWASGGTKDTVFRISVIDMLRTIGKEAYDLSL